MCAAKSLESKVLEECETSTSAEVLDFKTFHDTEDYFKDHHLRVYFEDAVAQFLSLRLESNKLKPNKFLKEYFCSVHQGTHVLFREYEFICATSYNRLCVLKAIMQIYKSLHYQEQKLNAHDYHSLLQLLWPDMPFHEVNAAFIPFETTVDEEAVTLSFLDFVKALKSSFCTLEYDYESEIIDSQLKIKMEELSKIYKQGDKGNSYLSEADFLSSLDENVSDQASSWSVASNYIPNINNEFRRILSLKESNSFSSDEPAEIIGGKLSRSSSGSKDASKSDQNVSAFSKSSMSNLRGKQLSNSLNLLQTEKLDTENNLSNQRLRSKSAVSIQRGDQQKKPFKP